MGDAGVVLLVADMFDAEWRRSYLAHLRALVTGRCADDLAILPFNDTLAALGRQGEITVGRQEVEIDAIVGSVSRAGDFDRQFRPRNRCLRDRWNALAGVERDLPAVSLIRLGELYFVEDGHHRVSVARAKGIRTIRAHVRRITTLACSHRCLTVADLPAKTAERIFLERVPLPDDVRIGLCLDNPAEWSRLADAAEAWGFRQHLAGRSIADKCRLAEAWWAEEVVPVAAQLRARGICTSTADIEVYRHNLVTCDLPVTSRTARSE